MSKLSPQDWITAGFAALIAKGPQALKAELLAKEIGATKGSFYWHFKDVPAFQSAMLRQWEDLATQILDLSVTSETEPVRLLRALSSQAEEQESGFAGSQAEPAIRAWAKSDRTVADAVARVDALRLERLKEIFAQIGLTNSDLPTLFYASILGLQDLSAHASAASLGTLTDLMIAMSETD